MARRLLTVALAGTAVFSLAATAADSGTFRSITTFRHDTPSLEFADQAVTDGALQGVNTIIESSGGPFKESS